MKVLSGEGEVVFYLVAIEYFAFERSLWVDVKVIPAITDFLHLTFKKKSVLFIEKCPYLSKFFFRQCYVERLIKSVYQCVLNQLLVWKAPTNDSNSRPNFLYFFEVPPQVKYFLWSGVTTLMTSFWCLYC